jgi:hypothetical protein
MKDLKIKGGSFDMWSSRCCRCCYRNVRIYYRQGDGDAATALLKKRRRRFDEQYFKGVGTGASLGLP